MLILFSLFVFNDFKNKLKDIWRQFTTVNCNLVYAVVLIKTQTPSMVLFIFVIANTIFPSYGSNWKQALDEELISQKLLPENPLLLVN